MKNQEVSRQLQRLNDVFKKAGSVSNNDPEILSHWAKYLCVLSAGFLENSISELYISFTKGAASEPVVNYASSTLVRIRNPKTNKFIETALAFKKSWGEELEKFVEEEGRKEAIDTIMANRHLIAHGKHSGITLARLKQYLERSIEVLDFIEKQLPN